MIYVKKFYCGTILHGLPAVSDHPKAENSQHKYCNPARCHSEFQSGGVRSSVKSLSLLLIRPLIARRSGSIPEIEAFYYMPS